MPLVSGTFTNIGDELVVQLDPFTQVTGFDSFIDSTSNVTGTRFFKKEFRYASDGVNFSNWEELTNSNLQAVTVSSLLVSYWVEVRYTRDGTDTTGTLEWNSFSMTVNVSTASNSVTELIFNNDSMFLNIDTSDTDWAKLCGNLTNKLIEEGIIPNKIERTKDYEDFWHSVACFFALLFVFANQITDLYNRENYLRDWLIQWNYHLCGNKTLSELQTLARDRYKYFHYRGGGAAFILDYIKTLMCIADCGMFEWASIPSKDGGWYLNDTSSPNYNGLDELAINQMKYYSIHSTVPHSLSALNVADYHTLQDSDDFSIQSDTLHGISMSSISIINASGFSGLFQTGASNDKLMAIDTSLFYEISFYVKQPVLSPTLQFSVSAYDCDKNPISGAFEDVINGNINDIFFANYQLPKNDEYYLMKGIIFPLNHPLFTQYEINNALLNNGSYQNLRFASSDIRYIYPKIYVGNGFAHSGNETRLCGFYVRPLKVDQMPKFLNLGQYTFLFAKNGSVHTDDKMKQILRRYYIPVSSTLNWIQL